MFRPIIVFSTIIMPLFKPAAHAHPYYPPGLRLPGYHPPLLPFEHVLAYFFGGCAVIFITVLFIIGKHKGISTAEKTLVCWLIVTGIIHFVIEGKEYAKADSRYATRDAFVIAMEAVTAFVEGPCCFAAAYGILMRAPWRYTMMMLVSLGQIYGDVLYFATCWIEEPLYFWFYFVIVNGIWIVVPSLCIAFAALRVSASVKKMKEI